MSFNSLCIFLTVLSNASDAVSFINEPSVILLFIVPFAEMAMDFAIIEYESSISLSLQ